MNNKPEIKPRGIGPLKHICMTIGELPSSYLETMTYYEMLVWFTKFLKDTMIPTLDNNALAVEELQNLFIQLQSYVNDYFDNLDVQEEIDNKLDEMTEAGTLQEIIADYLNSKAVFGFDTVSDMKDGTNLIDGSYARTLGFHYLNDGGSALYKIRTITNNDVVDEKFIIALNDNLLIAELITDNLNIKQLGANETVSNDTSALQSFANSNIKKLIIPYGNYKLNDIVDLEDKELIGIGNPTININGITTEREHTIHVIGSCHIKGINFIQTIANTNIMGLFGSHDTIIEKCSFKVDDVKCNGYVDLYTDNHNIRILNCDFDCVSTEIVDNEKVNAIGGVWVRQVYTTHTSDNITFENCTISHQSKDEAIGVWNDRTPCLLSNVKLINCIIKDKANATNPHLITFNANNSSINNCIFERNINNSTGISSMIHQISSTAVITQVNNCVFNTNVKHGGGIFNTAKCLINNCVINDTSDETRLINHGKIKNSTINCNSFQNQYSDVELENCELTMSAQTHSWLFRHSCRIINCIFNFLTANPGSFFYLLGTPTDEKIIINGNLFNTYGEESLTLANMNNTTSNTNKIYAINNTFVGNITSQGSAVGVFANNIMTTSPLTYTDIKANNNFNIGS